VNPGGDLRLFLALDALHLDQPSSTHGGERRPRKYDILMDPFPNSSASWRSAC
jgi:hypothetical protein